MEPNKPPPDGAEVALSPAFEVPKVGNKLDVDGPLVDDDSVFAAGKLKAGLGLSFG